MPNCKRTTVTPSIQAQVLQRWLQYDLNWILWAFCRDCNLLVRDGTVKFANRLAQTDLGVSRVSGDLEDRCLAKLGPTVFPVRYSILKNNFIIHNGHQIVESQLVRKSKYEPTFEVVLNGLLASKWLLSRAHRTETLDFWRQKMPRKCKSCFSNRPL